MWFRDSLLKIVRCPVESRKKEYSVVNKLHNAFNTRLRKYTAII